MSLDVQKSVTFRAALAVGDIDADRFADVVIGALTIPSIKLLLSGSWNISMRQCRRCQYFVRNRNGLNAAGDQFFNQNSSGIEELAQTGDEFGAALSLGDLNSDGFLDLVIGAPVKPSTVITTLALPTSSTATQTV